MIQHQQWHDAQRVIVVDERNRGTVQMCIPAPNYEESRIEGKADALIYALWVDEPYRGQGGATYILETIENEARRMGLKSVCLEWDNRDTPEWVLRWYERLGYVEKEFGRHISLLVKQL